MMLRNGAVKRARAQHKELEVFSFLKQRALFVREFMQFMQTANLHPLSVPWHGERSGTTKHRKGKPHRTGNE